MDSKLLFLTFISLAILHHPAHALCVPRGGGNASRLLPPPKQPSINLHPPVSSPVPSPALSPTAPPTGTVEGKTDTAALETICKKTDYPDLCVASISPFFNGDAAPATVLQMSIKACTQYSNVALEAAKALVKAPTTPPRTVSILGDCTDLFSDALDNLQNAMDSIASHDIGTINSMLSAAVTDFVTCDDGFEGEPSPMAAFDAKLSNMASNCLAIASLI